MRVRLPLLLPLILLFAPGCGPQPVPGSDDNNPFVGQPAPDFQVDTFAKKAAKVSLKDMLGKVVIMDFWATYCGPCKMLNPYLEKIYSQYHDQGLEGMAITPEPVDKVGPFEKNTPHVMPVYLDTLYLAANAYKIEGIPTVVVVDRKGNVVFMKVGFAENPSDPHAGPQGEATDVEAAVKQALSS
jgi:thiol-disulfide isomerase/thioredoxin